MDSTQCRGQYSIQLEINRIAYSEGGQKTELNPDGRKWSALIQDKAWRERVRLQLRSQNSQWCDHYANECSCEDSYMSEAPRHNPDWVTGVK